MTDPVVAQKKPYFAAVVAGKEYLWCACGKSSRQPFCDDSHQGTGIEPVKFTATDTKDMMLCGCKHTKNAPRCDGSHSKV